MLDTVIIFVVIIISLRLLLLESHFLYEHHPRCYYCWHYRIPLLTFISSLSQITIFIIIITNIIMMSLRCLQQACRKHADVAAPHTVPSKPYNNFTVWNLCVHMQYIILTVTPQIPFRVGLLYPQLQCPIWHHNSVTRLSIQTTSPVRFIAKMTSEDVNSLYLF